MKNNWMQEYERKKDKRREKFLNNVLEKALNDWENIIYISRKGEFDEIPFLERIVIAYEDLKREAIDCDDKDYEKKKRRLECLKYKKMEKEYKENVRFQRDDCFEEDEYEH